MPINVCIAGTTGWTGSVVARHLLQSDEFEVVGALARREAGRDLGDVLGLAPTGLSIVSTFDEVLASGAKPDVLIDYTKPDSVKARTLAALENGVRVVVGTSGLTATDYAEIERLARDRGLGVIAAGNFSITATLAKHFALIAARYVPTWELIDYASASKIDAPSGTVQELAEALGQIADSQIAVAIARDTAFGAPVDERPQLGEARFGERAELFEHRRAQGDAHFGGALREVLASVAGDDVEPPDGGDVRPVVRVRLCEHRRPCQCEGRWPPAHRRPP